MMPGETPPPPAGSAAAAACANCGVLQQNINEYVAALIALKQKMIDGDHLLAEYQQKCTELQFAEREISALRCQVEQMLQKILPLEKCQEELGSLKAELEEKKSSLKIYQDSQLEYVKIKEEIVNSDAVRKKLETKVKKLEEAATKHTQDFRQLKNEKKRLEKELKQAQGKLDGVLEERCRKVKHVETQSSSEDLRTDIDKEKIKLLLEELWMCIDSATGKRENRENGPVLASIKNRAWPEKRRPTVTEETIQIQRKIRKCDGKTLPWYSSLESAGMQLQASAEPFGCDCVENSAIEECLHSDEDKTVDVVIQTDGSHSSSDFSDQEHKDPGGNVMDILNWAKPLPALLSPVQLSPLTTEDILFGEVTSSSDKEVDCSAATVGGILPEVQVQPQSCNVFSFDEECIRQNKSCEHGLDAEISCNLSWNERNVYSSPKMSSKEERDAETKQAESATVITNMETIKDHLEENSENLETEKRELTEAIVRELEAFEEEKGDSEDVHSEEGGSQGDFVLHKSQNQMEKCSEVERAEENVILIRAVDYEGTREKHGELTKAERDGLSGESETPRAVSVHQNVTPLPPEQCIVLQSEDSEEKSDVLMRNEVVENESKNVIKVTNTASDMGENINQVKTGEEITAAIQKKGLRAAANNERELSENVLSCFSSSKSFCEVECPKDRMIQHNGEGIIMETEADTGAMGISAPSQFSEIKHDSEEVLEKQYVQTVKDEAERECESETVKVSRHYLPVTAIKGIRNSLSMDNIDKNVGMERAALSAFPKDDEQLKIEGLSITRPETIELAMKFNRESVLEIAVSSELLYSTENRKSVDTKEGEYLKGKPHQEGNGSNLSQGKSDMEGILALPKTAHIIDAESSVAKYESSVLDFTEIKDNINQPENLCSPLECELSKTENFRVFESQEAEFKFSPEDFREESGELLERVDTIESVLESNLASQAQFAKPPNQFLVAENVKCDIIKGEINKQSQELVTETCSGSFNCKENVVKKNTVSEITCQPAAEMDFNSGLGFSTQGDLEMGCINTEETYSPVQVGIGLESAMPPDRNFSLQKVVSFVEINFTEKAAFSRTWENKGDKNCVTGSAFNCSSESLEEGAEILSAEKDMCKELDCPEREYIHKNHVKILDEKEQPVDKEPQAPVKSQILDANSYNNTFLLQKFACQESECKTPTWEGRTDPSRTGSLTAEEERKELNSFEASGSNAIKRSKNYFDMPEQSNESEEDDCSIQKVRYVKCSKCIPIFRKELRTSSRIAVGALETGAIVDADYQVRELHSTMHPGGTLTVRHLNADTVVDMDTHCETNTSSDTANELSSVVGEGYPKHLASWKRECILVTSENTEGANECVVDSNRAGWINDSEESMLKTETSKESPVMPSASKNGLPLCQLLTSFSETCRVAVKNSKLNPRMVACGNFLEVNDTENLQSNVEQSLLQGLDVGVSVFEEYNRNRSCTACNIGENNTDFILDSSSRKKKIVKFPNPALSDVEYYCHTVRQPAEPQKPVFENLYMLESESCVDVALKKSDKLKRKEQEPSEIVTLSAKTAAQVMHAKLSKRLFQGKRKTKTLKVKLTQPVVANADTSMPTKCSSEIINKIRQEMGLPLPPLLLPLIGTPPKTAHTMSPVMSSTGRSSLLSPLDDLISPLHETPVPPLMSPLTDTPTVKSALLFSPPSPSEMAVGRKIRSSPLKFCTSIPKHALPVPGRFPQFAADSAAPGAPQENSVKILDTMYPELSARARTLNILKGNIQLNRCAFSDSQSLPGPVAQIGGFKAIASTSTAFVKTGSNLKSDGSKDQDKDVQNQQLFSDSSNHLEKQMLLPVSMPRSAKRLRLDSEPPKLEPSYVAAIGNTKNTVSEIQEAFCDKSCEISDSARSSSLEASQPVNKVIDPDRQEVSLALKKIAESCFDLLPVIKGHVYVGNISMIPVMRDEEKEVVHEFGIKNKHLAESLLHVIINKLKAQKNVTSYNFNQALCRVYTGICRQLGDLERARLFCYSLLKEGFPDSEKLILFIANVWSDIFVFQGAINKAMQLVVRQSASSEILACLSAYLNWEQSSSLDAGIMVSNLLLEMQSCPKIEFQLSEQYGEDLSEDAWQYIFAVDLLCSHLKWDWTHDNVISKVLWPSMDKWVKKRKGHETAQSIPDSVIALTLRLIGRLGQIGLKEGYLGAVQNISSVIGLFVQHAKEEGVPWGVQLAAIYSLCDLGSSNPEGIVEAIRDWRATAVNNIPLAVTSGIVEINSLCKMGLD